MILVDSSIWIDHLRKSDPVLVGLLDGDAVLVHPWIIGELALGHLLDRKEVIEDLQTLPETVLAADFEVLAMIERDRIYGFGIGWVDAHLLAATRLTTGAQLWTRDRRLRAAAERLGLAAGL